MTGHWAGSNRRNTLPPDWPRTRQRILHRDHHRCSLCGQPATDVDHISGPGDHRDTNLRSLCPPCHGARSSAQGNAARWAHPKRRPNEVHPGLRGVGGDPNDHGP